MPTRCNNYRNESRRTQRLAQRTESIRRREQRWIARATAARRTWVYRQQQRLQRYQESFRASWLTRIGLGFIAIWRLITDPPFTVRRKTSTAGPVMMIPFMFNLKRKDRAVRRPRFASTGQSRISVEALEQRQLLAGDLLYVDNASDFVVTTDQGAATLNSGDTVTWAGADGAVGTGGDDVAGLTFEPIAPASVAGTAYDSIQEAIDAAGNGDTVHIAPGVFSGNLTIDKEITLLGAFAGTPGNHASRSLVDGTGETTIVGVIDVQAHNVTLDGLRVLDGGTILSQNAGVYVRGDNVTLTNSVLYRTGAVDADTYRGVVNEINSVSDLTVTDNAMQGWHTGVYVQGVEDTTVSGNLFEENLVGMSADATAMGKSNLDVTGNIFLNNGLEGMGIYGPSGHAWDASSTISGNTFTGPGIFTYGDGAEPGVIAGNTHTVTAGGSIQAAIDAAFDGDTISIGMGTYPESLEIENRTLTLAAESPSGTIIENGTSNLSISGGSSVTVTGLTFQSASVFGITIEDSSSLLLQNSEVIGSGNIGVFIDTSGPVSIDQSRIVDNFVGVLVDGSATSTVTITGTDLSANTNKSVQNASASIVNASSNWWGTNVAVMVLGKTTGNVDFSPFLNSDADSDSGATGFVGDYSTLNVTALGAQSGGGPRIQEAIDHAAEPTLVKVHDGTYHETVTIDHSMTLQSVTAQGALLSPNSGTNQAVVTVAASGVEIRDLDFLVNQSNATAGIYMQTVGDAYDDLTIDNNDFRIEGIATANGATSFVGFGTDSTAIAIRNTNDGTSAPTVTITNNNVFPQITTGDVTAIFDRAIFLRAANGLVDGNVISGDSHDLAAQFVGHGTLTVSNNFFNGVGGRDTKGAQLDITEPNPHGNVEITGNTFNPLIETVPSGSAHVRSLMIKNNTSGVPVVIDNNVFTVSEVGILVGNSNATTITNNTFDALAGDSDFVHVQVSNKVATGGAPNPVEMNATIQGNTFGESNVAGGRGIEFLNHNAAGATFGTITIGGAGLLANTFEGDLDQFIYLDAEIQADSTDSSRPYYHQYGTTTTAPFAANLDVQDNLFDLGAAMPNRAGSLDPVADLPDLFALEDKIHHALDVSGLGVVTFSDGHQFVTTDSGSIQRGVDAADAGDTVNVVGDAFVEDVNVIQPVHLLGAGPEPGGTTISGVMGGNSATIRVSASNVEIEGFTITREGNNTTDWNDPTLNSAGIAIQGQSIAGTMIHGNTITGNRTGIDVNNSSDHVIANNVIDDNRTGLLFRNQTDGLSVQQNKITNNWTVGILFLDASSGTNSPVQTAINSSFFNNDISGNWYGQIVERQSGGSLPTPGTNLKDFSGNWFGTNNPVISTANSTEPGYASQIPVAFGGTAVAPGGQPDVLGPGVENFDITSYLDSGVDTDPATFGFQGDFSTLHVIAELAQDGAAGRLTEAVGLLDATGPNGGTLHIHSGTYTDNLDATSKRITLAPGSSPGQVTINGDLTLDGDDTLPIELDGTDPATQYDNLVVNGIVDLGDAELEVNRGFSPTPGVSFTIIDNDGTDPVSNTFDGLDEGNMIMVAGVPMTVSYVGGDGNDVELTIARPTEVWVNDTWQEFSNDSGGSPGTVEPGDTVQSDGVDDEAVSGKTFGYDAFATLQDAIDAVADGGTVHVLDGVYDEAVTINRSITFQSLTSQGAMIAPTTGSQQSVISVSAPNVTISGFALQVNQNDDGSGSPVAPVGISAIPNGDSSVDFDNLVIDGNIITSVGDSPANWSDSPSLSVRAAGIVLYDGSAGTVPTVSITNNTVDIDSGASFFQRAIWLAQVEANVTGNTLSGAANDLLFQFASAGAGGDGTSVIDGNNFVGQHRGGGGGLNISGPNGSATGIQVSNNAFTPTMGDPFNTQQAAVINQNPNSVPISLTGNTFTGHVIGVSVGNAAAVSISGNTFTPTTVVDFNTSSPLPAYSVRDVLSGNDYVHIAIDSDAPSSGDSTTLPIEASIDGNSLKPSATSGAIGTAITVADNLPGSTFATAGVQIGVVTDNIYTAGLTTGIAVTGGVATVSDQVEGTTESGVAVSGGTAVLTAATLTGNDTGTSVSADGTLTVGIGNTITGGTTGLLFDGTNVALTGLDLNDLTISGQSGNHIALTNNAFDDGDLDGTGLSLGGIAVSAMTPTQRAQAGEKILDELDDGNLGLIRLGTTIAVMPVGTATATDNDYLRIMRAVEAANDGDTIMLVANGADNFFDWDETNALASWELGNDGVAGGGDDWAAYLPAGLSNVKVTADDSQDITIQGPGDIATADLEGVFASSGENTGWTFENFDILDFDVAIGMYSSTGTHYSGLKIQNLDVRVAADDPSGSDAFQNIGLYYSGGDGITITNNRITLDGSGSGTSLAIQSTTHGGDRYDGLQITNNTISVQNAGGEKIYGIWENGHAHESDITVSGNTFMGNTGNTDVQTAFRVTSHSSASTTVQYSGNTVGNADTAFKWLDVYGSGSVVQDYSGSHAVLLTNNTVSSSGIAVDIGGIDAKATLTGNDFEDLTNDNTTDIRIADNAGVVTIGALNAFGGDRYFIENLSSQDIDLVGTTSTFDETNNFRIEDKMYHGPDNATSGLIRVSAGQVYVTGNSVPGQSDETIQLAVDAAAAWDTVNIEAGTYIEQVWINKNLTVVGAGMTTVIQSPTTLDSSFVHSGTKHAILSIVDDANVSVSGLTVAGAGNGGTVGSDFVGIGVYNAHASINDVTVQGVRDMPLNGSQRGRAIFVGNDSGTHVVSVTNSTIKDYQKNGIDIRESGGTLSATITGNTITGTGPTGEIAQNGIVLLGGVQGTVADNTIMGHEYTTTGTDSTGILLYNNGIETVAVANNTLSGNDVGVYTFNSDATVVANSITGGSSDSTGIVIDGGTVSVTNHLVLTGNDTGISVANGIAAISGNTLTGNIVGVGIGDNGELSIGVGNTISGGTTGALLDGSTATLTGDSLGSISIGGQSGDYVALTNGAYDDSEIDGTGLSLGGIAVSAMTPTQRAQAGEQIRDELDDSAVGLVRLGTTIAVMPVVTATATDNDYLRIMRAVEAANDGDTIVLVANDPDNVFNWNEPFALASWELGNDGVASTDDDWGVLLGDNQNNVTVTAELTDGISIQGPGDVATANLEGVFVAFDNGTNTGWTFENFSILDFDNAIGFYFSGDDYSNLTVQNMTIRVAADSLSDGNQNIGVYYSRGTNITINNNLFEFVGNGNGTSFGIQSTTHGGVNYDNLKITNNDFVVLNGGDERIYGVWENGHTHESDIMVANNTFIGHAGNTNSQIGFRVTSHSGATSTVSYSDNTVDQADVGFDWLDVYFGTPQDYTGTLPVQLSGNIVTNTDTAFDVGGIDASADISGGSVTGNSGIGVDIASDASASVSGATLRNLDIGVRIAGSASIADNMFDNANDNLIDVQLLTSASAITIGPGNTFGGDDYFIDNQSSLAIDLTSTTATFDETGDFRIEDKMFHAVDDSSSGLIRTVAGELFVTTPGTGNSDESIQNAVDAADAGDLINVETGTYDENVTIDKDIDISGDGSGGTSVSPSTGTAFTVLSTGTFGDADDQVTLDHINLDGVSTASYGVRVESGADVALVSVSNADITNFRQNGIYVSGSTATSALVDQVNLSDLIFSNNGITGGGGSADIQFFGFNNNASLSNLTLVGNRNELAGTGAQSGIQFRGVGDGDGINEMPIGTVSLTNVDISGKYKTQMIGVQRYSDVNNLTFTDVALGGTSSEITGGWGASLRFDGVGSGTITTPATVDLGNTAFRGLNAGSTQRHEIEFAPDNGFAFLRADGTETSWDIGGSDIAASALNLSQAFAVENRILHYVDKLNPTHGGTFGAYKGFVDIQANQAFVTDQAETDPETVVGDGSIQRGVDIVADGGTVNVAAGAFVENVTIPKDVDIVGDSGGGTTVSPLASGTAFTVLSSGTFGTVDDQVTLDHINLDGVSTASYGVRVESGADVALVSVSNADITNFRQNGIYVSGSTATSALVDQVNLSDLIFSNNGITGGGGSADIQFFGFNNNASLSNLTLVGNRNELAGTGAQSGIQFRGVGDGDGINEMPIGTVSLTNVDISGKYKTQMIGVQRYSDVNNLTFTDVALGGTSSEITGGWGASLRFDGVGSGTITTPATVDLGNTAFRGLNAGSTQRHEIEFAPDNGFAFLRADGTDTSWTVGGMSIEASSLLLPEAFGVEDRILHYVDKLNPTHGVTFGPYKGFVDIQSNESFITDAADSGVVGDGSIQRGVDIVSAGGTVHVSAGTFNESVTIDKQVTIDGEGPTNSIINPASSNGFNISSDFVVISDLRVTNADDAFEFTGSSDGVQLINVQADASGRGVHIQGSATNLTLNNATLTGNVTGMRVATQGVASGLSVLNSQFNANDYGVTVYASNSFTNNETNFSNILIQDSSFSSNEFKGLYFEKLNNADLMNVTVDQSGTTGSFGAGIDINLKYGNYADIDIIGGLITDSGTGGAVNGAGLTIKARGTGNDPSYSGNPAILHDLLVDGMTLDGNQHGIRIGEPGKDNTGPTNVVLDGLTITNSVGTGLNVVGGQVAIKGSTINVSATGIDVAGSGILMAENNNLTSNTIGVLIQSGALVDLGDAVADGNVTGLGSSTGGNNFTGYTSSSSSTGAIVNLNPDVVAGPQGSPPDVPAFGNTFDATLTNALLIENAIYHDGDDTNLQFVDFANLANLTVSLDMAAVNEGDPVQILGTFANDPQDHTLTIDWGDGTPTETIAVPLGTFDLAGLNITHSYADGPATHNIQLTLDEDYGSGQLTDNSLTVMVNDVSPTLMLSGASNVDEGSSYTLNLASSDPGDDTITQWVIDWGDGTVDTIAGNPNSATHTYDDGNVSRNISATVTDEDGTHVGTGTFTVMVDNVAPTLTISGASNVDEGSVYTLNLASSDPGVDTITQWEIDWGDGTAVETVAGNPGTASHTYADGDISHVITATATDEDGTYAASGAVNVFVDNVDPTLSISGATNVDEGAPYTLNLSSSDPGDDAITQWEINWGDGTPVQTVSGDPSSVTHMYADGENSYVIGATATDEDGTYAAAGTVNVMVKDVAPTVALSGAATHDENSLSAYSLTLGPITDPGMDTVISATVIWGDGNFTTLSPSELSDIQSGTTTLTKVYDDDELYTGPISVVLYDEDGVHADAGTLPLVVNNVAPTGLAFSGVSVNEGSNGLVIVVGQTDPSSNDIADGFKYDYDFNNNGVIETALGEIANSSSASATIPGSFLLDDPNHTVRVVIKDNDGGATDLFASIQVNNVAPTFDPIADSTAFLNAGFTKTVTITDPGAEGDGIDDGMVPNIGWHVQVDFDGDSTFDRDFYTTSRTFDLSDGTPFVYTSLGTMTATVKVDDQDGGVDTETFDVEVIDDTFRVVDFQTSASGFSVQFNRSPDLDDLNLYDGADNGTSLEAADLSIVGASTGMVMGSMTFDPASNTLHFVKTGGILADDVYTVVLTSDAAAFNDDGNGALLDGNNDFAAGGDYVNAFSVSNAGARIVGFANDFARGAGQAIDLTPDNGADDNLTIRISDAAGVTAVDLDLTYDPNLLDITNVTKAVGLPGDWSVTFNTSTPGLIELTASGVTPLAGSNVAIYDLEAEVPETAAYAASHVLDITELRVNEGNIPAVADDAIHKAVYLGDVTGNAGYSALDSSLISRVVVNLDSGFDEHDWTDPVIVGDATGDGTLSGLDASYVAQKSVSLPRPEIPNLPAGVTPIIASGPDPTVQIDLGYTGTRGGTTPVFMEITDDAAGLLGANFEIGYDTTQLDLANGDVSAVDLLAGWSVFANVNDATGTALIAVFNTTPHPGGTGNILQLDFGVAANAPAGTTTLDVEGELNEGGLTITPVDGSFMLDVDVTIGGAPANSPEGTAINLTSSTVGEVGGIASYNWSVVASNGQVIPAGTGASFSFTPTDNGTYTVTLDVVDGDGNSGTTTEVITATNVAPTIDGVTYSAVVINEDGSVTVSGTVNDDGSADTIDLVIQWGDGSPGIALSGLAPGATFSQTHTYEDDGTSPGNGTASDDYTLTVTATDDDGDVDSVDTTITVNNVAPINLAVTPDGGNVYNEGETLSFTASADDNADDVLSYSWSVTGPGLGSPITGTGTAISFVPADNGNYTIDLTVSDDDLGTTTLTYNVPVVGNVAPTIDGVTYSAVVINEDGSVTVSGTVNDDGSADTIDLVIQWGDGSPGIALSGLAPGATFSQTHTYEDDGTSPGNGTASDDYTLTVTATDDDGDVDSVDTTITVNNVAPAPVITGVPAGNTTEEYNAINLGVTENDPGTLDAFTYAWTITKDGSPFDSGTSSTISIPSPEFGTYQITVVVNDDDTGVGTITETITVTPVTFRVINFVSNESGFDAVFNRGADFADINLYDGIDASIDLPDVVVTNSSSQVVDGSLSYDGSSPEKIRWVASGSVLPADTYTVTLVSDSAAWKDTRSGQLLDGDSDGTVGDNFVTSFTVTNTAPSIGLPDFIRGPQQAVDLPATGFGMPVTLTDGSGVTSVAMTIEFDPSLLDVTAASLSTSVPGDWLASVDVSTPGLATLSASGTTPLGAGVANVFDLIAEVPAGAAFGASQVIEITSAQLNGGAVNVVGDHAFQKIGFFGDPTANRSYTALDAALIARVAAGLDTGFDAYGKTDPKIIGDISGNGIVGALDASLVAQHSVELPVPEIPALPAGTMPTPITGVDPLVSFPDLTATAGSTVNSVASIDNADTLQAIDLTVDYDTTRLDLSNADISLTGLTASGWTIITNVNDPAGHVSLAAFTTTPLGAGAGDLLDFAFHVPTGAPLGVSPVDIVAEPDSLLNEGALALTDDDGTIEIVDATAPTVASVKVAGNIPMDEWTTEFKDFIDPVDGDNTDGSDQVGYQIPTATLPQQLTPLPWVNLNQIIITFSEPVVGSGTLGNSDAIQLDDINVFGVNKEDYKVSDGQTPQLINVDFDPSTNQATLTFDGALTADKLLIHIADGTIEDASGNPLDELQFRINVLPGDVDGSTGVFGTDVGLVRGEQFTFTTTPGFKAFYDVNGSGSILGTDVGAARARQFTFLPNDDPEVPVAMMALDAADDEDADETDESWQEMVDTLFSSGRLFS